MSSNSELKNPVFWCVIAFFLGMGLGIWGMIKADCIGGPGCWIGSGFLKWAGGILIGGGLIGFFTVGNRK